MRQKSIFTSAALEQRRLIGVCVVVNLVNKFNTILIGVCPELFLMVELRHTESPFNSRKFVLIIQSEELLEELQILGDLFHLVVVYSLDEQLCNFLAHGQVVEAHLDDFFAGVTRTLRIHHLAKHLLAGNHLLHNFRHWVNLKEIFFCHHDSG